MQKSDGLSVIHGRPAPRYEDSVLVDRVTAARKARPRGRSREDGDAALLHRSSMNRAQAGQPRLYAPRGAVGAFSIPVESVFGVVSSMQACAMPTARFRTRKM
jgi:hypothetical protein